MCRSTNDGGRRCDCSKPEHRRLKRRAKRLGVTVDELQTLPEVWRTGNIEQRAEAARTATGLAWKVAQQDAPRVRLAAAQNPEVAYWAFYGLMREATPIRRSLAGNPRLADDQYRELAADPSPVVRLALAQNPHVPVRVLRSLAKGSPAVAAAAARTLEQVELAARARREVEEAERQARREARRAAEAEKRKAAAVKAAQTRAERKAKGLLGPTNDFRGMCGRCGQVVPAEAGYRKKVEGKWVVFHPEAQCPEVSTAPEGHQESESPSGAATNAYGGKCTMCGIWVDPGAGIRERGEYRWTVRHRTRDDCREAKKAAPPTPEPKPREVATTMTNRRPGTCTRCAEPVAAGEGTLTRAGEGARWAGLVHQGGCEDRGVIVHTSIGDYANNAKALNEYFTRDGVLYRVVDTTWFRTQDYTDEWADSVEQVARPATPDEVEAHTARVEEARRARAEQRLHDERVAAREAMQPDAATAKALDWYRSEVLADRVDTRDRPMVGGGREVSVTDAQATEGRQVLYIEPEGPDRRIWSYGEYNRDHFLMTTSVPWSAEAEAMAELVNRWKKRPLPEVGEG